MGNPTGGYSGSTPLPQQVQGAYTNALNQSGQAAAGGATALTQGLGYGSMAGEAFGDMSNFTPSDVTAGMLSGTNLSPYMNPYTQDVIDATMRDLNTQFGVQRQGIDDEAASQYAFGGDRQQLQKGVLGDKFLDTKARTLADLWSKNFTQAQEGARYDIGNRLDADKFNTDWRSRLYGAGAEGLGGLATAFGGIGSDLARFGVDNLGQLANMGFGWGNELQKNQLAMGALQTQQQQQLIDAIHAQALGYSGSPQASLASYLGAILNPPTGTGTSTTNPGLLSYIGAGANLLGSLNPFG